MAPGMPHHVMQRGNRRMQTFFGDDDYLAYLSMVRRVCGRWGNRIWAYCLMPNHVHLIVVPETPDGFARGIGEAHRQYARRVNLREKWQGHLWQARFSSYVMDEPYLMAAARYIERNPVKGDLVDAPADWPWSSARAHCDGGDDGIAEGDWLLERIAGWVCTWAGYLQEPDDDDLAIRMRRLEATGRPLGDAPFLERLATRLGFDPTPKKRGRPAGTK
ncbi:MAG: transposase [Planctomycetota bacterium]